MENGSTSAAFNISKKIGTLQLVIKWSDLFLVSVDNEQQ